MLNQYNALFIITFIKLFIYIWHNLYTSGIASVTFHFFFVAGSWKGNLYKFYPLYLDNDGFQMADKTFLCVNVSWREYVTGEMTGLKTDTSQTCNSRLKMADGFLLRCRSGENAESTAAVCPHRSQEETSKWSSFGSVMRVCGSQWDNVSGFQQMMMIIVSHANYCFANNLFCFSKWPACLSYHKQAGHVCMPRVYVSSAWFLSRIRLMAPSVNRKSYKHTQVHLVLILT